MKLNFDLVNWNKVKTDFDDEKELYSNEFANTVSTYRFLLVAKRRIYQDQRKAIDAYLEG